MSRQSTNDANKQNVRRCVRRIRAARGPQPFDESRSTFRPIHHGVTTNESQLLAAQGRTSDPMLSTTRLSSQEATGCRPPISSSNGRAWTPLACDRALLRRRAGIRGNLTSTYHRKRRPPASRGLHRESRGRRHDGHKDESTCDHIIIVYFLSPFLLCAQTRNSSGLTKFNNR